MPRYLFVTGKLAESALRKVLGEIAPAAGFSYDVAVLNITVAALMTPAWISRRLVVPEGIDRIIVPGLCSGDWQILHEATGLVIEPGPEDLRDLAEHFGQKKVTDYGKFDIEILAEINHANRLSLAELEVAAVRFQKEGADVIDLGCDPGSTWNGLGDAVQLLREKGLRVSIDTFNTVEAELGTKAGAELVLSVNSSNREAARDWGVEVVVIPDEPHRLETMDATVEFLSQHKVPFRLDPILEPVGFGFGVSLQRYFATRKRYPNEAMMMGIGNLTELTEVDSAGGNLLLISLCQELEIRSVLTTAVANWAYSSVAEIDFARRMTYHSIQNKVLPKKLDSKLVTLRDRKLKPMGQEFLTGLAAKITDPNFRLFVEDGQFHIINNKMHLMGEDAFTLFEKMCEKEPDITASHAFYLGYELAKMQMAKQLRKNYTQDQALNWGHLTVPEESHRSKRQKEQGGGDA